MRRKFGDSKISQEGDFVCPQTLFAVDLHSQWIQILQNTFANSNKTLRKSKKGLLRTAF